MVLVACALIAAGVVGVVTGAIPFGSTDSGTEKPVAGGPERQATTPTPTPTPTRPPAPAVLAAAASSPTLPTSAGLAAAIKSELASPELRTQHSSVAVRDVASGRLLYGSDAATGYIPASTTKILTSAAVLAVLGPGHRFTTKVVQGRTAGQIVLVGDGDPSLATADAVSRIATPSRNFAHQATVDNLAAKTAAKLKAAGTTQVQVLVDDTLFSEPINPRWESQYVPTGVVAPVSALWVDEAKPSWPAKVPRAKDPALTAGRAFVDALRANGITVAADPVHGKAPAKATTVASVQSPPLEDLVGHVLLVSDNDGAEILARHVAVAEGKPANFAGAAAAVKGVLARLGVKGLDKIALYDGSGLSRHNRISADVLTQVIAVSARPDQPELRPVLTGLPVAGFTGSLQTRFFGEADSGVGVVRAKTGTLSGVSSLAGVAATKDGAVLAFAVMTDKASKYDARPRIEEVAAILSGCGCR